MPERKIVMVITEEQAETIIEALDGFSRGACGQLYELLVSKTILEYPAFIAKKNKTNVNIDKIRDMIDKLRKQIFGFDPNTSLGIGNKHTPERAKVAYELYRELFRFVRKTINKSENIGVYESPTLHFSKQPMPQVMLRKEVILDQKIQK